VIKAERFLVYSGAGWFFDQTQVSFDEGTIQKVLMMLLKEINHFCSF